MNILYFHQYFKTPQEPGGTRSYWVSQELISRGHTVTIISGSNNITQNKVEKTIDGIRVIYLKIPYDNCMSIFQRMKSFIRFMLKATHEGICLQNIDLVIATSTPLTIGLPALIIKLFKKTPFVFEVRDLWPEVPIQMGGLKNSLLKKIAKSFEKGIYKNSSHIIALSPGMKEGIVAAHTPPEKISVIPNMAKIDKFWPRKTNPQIFTDYKLKTHSLKAIHFGSIGLSNGLDYLIDTACYLNEKEINDIDLILVGEGACKHELQQRVKEKSLSNVYFIGSLPMNKISELVNACDISLVTFLNLPILSTNSPNKFFDSLSAGKPIIVNSNGWTKTIIEKNNCGFYVNATKPQELADLLITLNNKRQIITHMGKNARKLAEIKYDKTILCNQFVEIIEKVKN